VKWLLLLDTEGLQSPERNDDEYDRKIILFAMLSADILIFNSKGDMDANILNTLKICTITFDLIKQINKYPEILYSFA
jgi:predicted GTPase